MALELTPGLAIALRRAGAIARNASRGAVEPLDLLRGLLAEAEGHAAQSLVAAGLDLSSWTLRFPDDARAEAAEAPLDPAPALRSVMARSARIGTSHGRRQPVVRSSAGGASRGGRRDRSCSGGLRVRRGALDERPRPSADAIPLDEPIDLTEPADTAGALRVIDAGANRAREALRVLEDHARFVQDDVLLNRLCKELRHDLAGALADVPDLLAYRDTVHDVGTEISTPAEGQRGSLQSVVSANAKRLQEALRSLEEFGKILGPAVGAAMEKLRYRAYTLEKALVLGGDARRQLAGAHLYALVSEESCRTSLAGAIRDLADGGVDIIQLRDKKLGDRALLAQARMVRELTRRLGILFVLNDRPDIAALCEADGVHLGQDDVPIQGARRIVGPKMLIGVSTHDISQARRAVLEGASYIGVGPTFRSQTKEFANFAGLAFVAEVAAETSLPAFAIGGITLDNLPQVLAAGVTRVAVGHAVCAADDPKRAAARFREMLRTT